MQAITGHMVHYGNGFAMLPDGFNLREDYERPAVYTAEVCTSAGMLLGRTVTVHVDHDATGTSTPGTGDTVVRKHRHVYRAQSYRPYSECWCGARKAQKLVGGR